MSGRLLLLDATNLGHRLFHAPSDRPLYERFGYALSRWRKATSASHALAIFDGPGPTWRHELWPAYKAKRSDDPSKRPSATDWLDIRAECANAGVPSVWIPGIEADDLIASYTREAVDAELDVAIVSSDKDMLQLVRVRDIGVTTPTFVRVWDPGSAWGKSLDALDVHERLGVWPDRVPDLLALAGDASDGYPGIKGIGPKTAAELIREHGGVEQIIDRAQLLRGKMRERVLEGADMARTCLRLATLTTSLRLPVPLESGRLRMRESAWR